MGACIVTGSLEIHSIFATETSKPQLSCGFFCLAINELFYAVLVS